MSTPTLSEDIMTCDINQTDGDIIDFLNKPTLPQSGQDIVSPAANLFPEFLISSQNFLPLIEIPTQISPPDTSLISTLENAEAFLSAAELNLSDPNDIGEIIIPDGTLPDQFPILDALNESDFGSLPSAVDCLDNISLSEMEMNLSVSNPKKSLEGKTAPIIGAPKKTFRKRLGLSESPVAAAEIDNSKNGDSNGNAAKKLKLYENPNKADPLVQRAGYAKSYRDKKKNEIEKLKGELEKTTEELTTAKGTIEHLKEKNKEQKKTIDSLRTDNSRKDDQIANFEKEMKDLKDKNAFSPQQTEEILKSISAVVKASCPKDAIVEIIVPERLAGKMTPVVGKATINAISSEENLRNRSFKISFDLDKQTNKLTAHKE